MGHLPYIRWLIVVGQCLALLFSTHRMALIGSQHPSASFEDKSSDVEEADLVRLSMPEKGLKRPRSEVKGKLKKVHPEGCYVCAVTRSMRFYHLPEDINDCGHLISEPERPDSMVLCRGCFDDLYQMRKLDFGGHRQEVRP
jgi:hypothetical protein